MITYLFLFFFLRKMADSFSVSVLLICLFSYVLIPRRLRVLFLPPNFPSKSPTTWLPLTSPVQWGLVSWSLIFPATGLGRKPSERSLGLTKSNPFTERFETEVVNSPGPELRNKLRNGKCGAVWASWVLWLFFSCQLENMCFYTEDG